MGRTSEPELRIERMVVVVAHPVVAEDIWPLDHRELHKQEVAGRGEAMVVVHRNQQVLHGVALLCC